MSIRNITTITGSTHMDGRTGFLPLGDYPVPAPSMPNAAARGLAFFRQLSGKYIYKRTSENFPLYFLRLSHLSDAPAIEHRVSFNPVFHWILVNRVNVANYRSVTPSLTPALTQSLTRLLIRSFRRSTAFTFAVPLHEEKRERERQTADYTYFIHQSLHTAAERVQAEIFNYFSALHKITSRLFSASATSATSATSLNYLTTSSLTRSLTPDLTRSLTRLLIRSSRRSTAFISHEAGQAGQIGQMGPIGQKGDRPEIARPDVTHTYLLPQRPEIGTERIRAELFNYFSTLDRIASQISATSATPATSSTSINHLITSSLTRSLTPVITRSLTRLLTRSLSRSTAFITHAAGQTGQMGQMGPVGQIGDRPEIARTDVTHTYLISQRPEGTERIRIELFNYFSTLDRIASQISATPAASTTSTTSINHLITSSLTRSLTPVLTRSLTRLLTRSFSRSTAFFTREAGQTGQMGPVGQKGDRPEVQKGDRPETEMALPDVTHTYLLPQRPESTERIRAELFNYFSTLDRIASQISAIFSTSATSATSTSSINHLITSSLTRSLTPAVTRSLTRLLTRSFSRSTAFITREAGQAGQMGPIGQIGLIGGQIGDRPEVVHTYLIPQRPGIGAGRIRAELFNYFSTLDHITSQKSAVFSTSAVSTSPINHLSNPINPINRINPIPSSITRSLTPVLTRSLTRFLTRSFGRSTTFITHGTGQIGQMGSIGPIGQKGDRPEIARPDVTHTYLLPHHPEIAIERIRDDIFNYFSTLDRITSKLTAISSISAASKMSAMSAMSTMSTILRPSISRLITHSLRQSPTPAVTQLLTRSLTRSFTRSFTHEAAFVSYLHKRNSRHKGDMEEIRGSRLEMENPPLQAEDESPGNKAPVPEAPGFERARLELRHTAAFLLAGSHDSQIPRPPRKAHPLVLPANKWMSSKTVTSNIVEEFKPLPDKHPLDILPQTPENRSSRGLPAVNTIDLRSLGVDNTFNPHPKMKHFPPGRGRVSEERIKKLEKTIVTYEKHLETRLKDAVTTSTSRAQSIPAGSPANAGAGFTQANLSNLADGVYKMLLDRIKRERSMRGY